MNRDRITILRDAEDVARVASEYVLESARASVRARDRFVVALSGGSTPRLLHRRLSAGPLRLIMPWSRTFVTFGDERFVPAQDKRSNFCMVRETLLDNVRIPHEQVLRMETEFEEPARAAERYEQRLRTLFPAENFPRIDLLLLGMGQDGHTASLFPGASAMQETEKWVVADQRPEFDEWRLTLTLPAIRAARRILFLITGEAKAQALVECFGDTAEDGMPPAGRTVPFDGDREILVDAAAARLLRRPS